VIHLFLHSSELQPGGNPQFPSEDAVQRLVDKIRTFVAWLITTGPVQGATLSELFQEFGGGGYGPPALPPTET